MFQNDLDQIHRCFEDVVNSETEVLGPSPAIYRYHKETEKWVVTLIGPKLFDMRNEIKEGLCCLKGENILDKNIIVQVEIDPLDIV